MEATILGIPAIAFSYTGSNPEDIAGYAPVLERLIAQIVRRDDFPRETLLNVNLPSVRPGELRGIKVTRLARRVYIDSLTRARDPSGREYFWIGGGETEWRATEGTDFHAVEEGYISVTPLHLDLTNYDLLADVAEWGLRP